MSVLTWTGLGLALACMTAWLARAATSGRLAGAAMLSLSLAGASAVASRINSLVGALLAVAIAGAALSLLWSAILNIARQWARRFPSNSARSVDACVAGAAAASITNGIISAVLIVTLLAARLIELAMLWLAPTSSALPSSWRAPPFVAAATSLGLLCASFLARLSRRGAPSLYGSASGSARFWLAVIAATWIAVGATPQVAHVPASLDSSAQGDTGSPAAVAVMAWSWHVSVGAVVILTVVADAWSIRRRKWRLVRDNPDALAEAPHPPRGLYMACAIAGLGLMVTGAVALTNPQALLPAGRLMLIAQSFTLIVGGAAILTLAHRAFTAGSADIGLALVTLGIPSACVACAPGSAPTAAERYPMVFNAMVVGFGMACWLWTWLANVWEQQLCDGVAWTTAGRLIPFARRFSFLSGCLALFQAGLLALWPRFPSVAADDDSLGRFSAGVGAHLGLALVLSWCARHGRRTQFHVLTVWTVLSLLAFVAARMLAYAAPGR